jgi:hypothetical protein
VTIRLLETNAVIAGWVRRPEDRCALRTSRNHHYRSPSALGIAGDRGPQLRGRASEGSPARFRPPPGWTRTSHKRVGRIQRVLSHTEMKDTYSAAAEYQSGYKDLDNTSNEKYLWPNFQKKRPYAYGRINNCGPGWHWQLVASVAQQQEAMRITTGQADKVHSTCTCSTLLTLRERHLRQLRWIEAPKTSAYTSQWKRTAENPLGLRPPATSCRCHPREVIKASAARAEKKVK